MRKIEINNLTMKSKIIRLLPIILLLLISSASFARSRKVEVSCSESAAEIYANGQLQGRGKVIIVVIKDQPMLVQIKEVGFLTDEFSIKYGGGVSPQKTYYRTLVKDEAYDASASTDLANIDISEQTSKTEDKAWRIISEIVTSYFDILEVSDKSTGYMRTAWVVQSFNGSTVRTRVIIKRSSSDGALKYKIKIISEIADAPNISVKDDEKFKSWDRILKKYNTLVSEFQTRLK